ncbi:hypothetical protein GCM10028803_10560 [Larkinella knui]|uniref:Uncharacterized protein n=1 Tax=Larkinella knui TaxID=2025310 RepID=A0A3P1CCG7_9BACT|nr:hypothetical protein [Larkinella knui]RRB10975.1 hypothetical protein EHT87_27935 [Larkinella knui]
MNRRTFVALGATTLGIFPILSSTGFPNLAPTKPEWLLEWIKINDQQLATIYKPIKITDPANRFVGGYMNDMDMPNPQSTAGFIIRACTLIGCPESTHYQSKALLNEVEAAARALLKMQHDDGTIDLLETNFHSTPDTAFVLENIIPAYTFLKQASMNGSETTLTLLKTFLQKAGDALSVGGIHTPNHRWVVSAALTRLNDVFPDPRYTNRIDQWLAEHIDLDPDGQFNEKSTNTYSPIVNRSLIILARGLKKPELFEPVRKNLMMTLYYVHPNGEIVTEASNRQDKGTIGNMARYYYCYRYMALLDKNGEMAALCRLIEKTCPKEQLAGYLNYFLEDPTLWRELPASKPLPTNYAKAFPFSGVVRIRRGNWDSTLLSNNASWLTFHKGNAVLQGMRMATTFFGKGQFDSTKIEQQGDSWVLQKSLDGPYYQPFSRDQIDPSGDWDKMPRANRRQSEIQKLDTTVKIKETANGLQIAIDIVGTAGVPVALELIFRAGGTLAGVTKHPKKDNAYLLSGESGSYTVGSDVIKFGPGTVEHKGVQLRGALPAMDTPTVYLTGFTPFHHTFFLS